MKIATYFIRSAYKLVISCACVFSAPSWGDVGYVYDISGDLYAATGSNGAHKIGRNDEIGSNTTVNTGDKSYAVLKFEDGQVVTMQSNSSFNIGEYRYEPKLAEKNNVVFSELEGGMRFVTGEIGHRNHQAFHLTTPNGKVEVSGSEFTVVMFKGSLYSQVKSGSIRMTNAAGMAKFNAGQFILVKSANTLPKKIPATALPEGIFSQLDGIPATPALPEPGSFVFDNESSGAPTSTAPDFANVAAMPGLSDSAMPKEANAASTLTGAPGETPSPPDETPAAPASPAAKPSATTISITGSGATYKGADLLCDFCTGRTKTKATHVEPKTTPGGPVTGDANLFSKHNLTPTGANTGEICAFCHAPQGAEDQVSAPRWNRALTTLSSYRAYSSLGSATQQATGSISMACLSCHDGSQAPNIPINTPELQLDVGDTMVTIGNDLRNHHPVGIQYAGGGQNQNAPEITTNPIAAFDRLRDMNRYSLGNKFSGIFLNFNPLNPRPENSIRASSGGAMEDNLTFSTEGTFESLKGGFNKSTYSGSGSGTVWWIKSPGSKKGRQKTDLYLFTRTDMVDTIPEESIENRPYVECATCHDPHSTNPTFLRMPGGNARSQICLACHNK